VIVDLIVFTIVAVLIVGGLWLLWNATAEAWKEYRQ